MIFLFDVTPDPISAAGPAGLGTAAAFFLVIAAGAFIVFKLLKRSVKMAFRMAIVAIILVIAVAGSIALWAIESKPSGRSIPRNQR
jgi:hypothetical protein